MVGMARTHESYYKILSRGILIIFNWKKGSFQDFRLKKSEGF